MQAAAVDNPRLPLRPVLVWAALVAIISGLGLIPFYAFVPDLSKFTGNLPAAQLALLGIAVELAAVGPSLAAILVAWRMPGAGGARSLFRQFRHWRVHPIWYLIALLLPIPILLAADVIWMALGRQSLVWLTVPGAIPFTIGAALVPPLGEEFGWRGFAQPRLQRRLGVFVPGGSKLFLPSDVAQTYIRLISTAVIYAWIYNSTGGSLPAVMVAHAAHNIHSGFIPGASVDPRHLGPLLGALCYAAAAIVIVLATNRGTLTRRLQASHRALRRGGT
ncbi:MAG: CPBP family intramembrane metalloprotease [Chloroflexi bacterium]|nr:MAG: CPBP family intramembrane metalloprotease [Chloroflexota bacterium]